MNEEREILTTGTVVYMAGEPWILEGDVSAKKLPEFRCPHCGGTQGTWFDRTFAVDADGNEVEPMCDRCCECGKNVNQ